MSGRQATQPFLELEVELNHPPALDVLIMAELPTTGPTFDPGTDPILIHGRSVGNPSDIAEKLSTADPPKAGHPQPGGR
jgi:hypothetical protein